MASLPTNDGSTGPAVWPRYTPVRGRHILLERSGYTHHGIDCGEGTVIDFGGLDGGKAAGCIRRVTLADFARGAPIQVQGYGSGDEPDLVIARAESMLGTTGYGLFANNCEHFATWCMTGSHHSAQVQVAASVVGLVAAHQLAPRLAGDAVTSLGLTAPASAANIMSGLKVVGGSPAGGVVSVAALGAAVGAGTLSLALRDKPYLTQKARDARRIGRPVGAPRVASSMRSGRLASRASAQRASRRVWPLLPAAVECWPALWQRPRSHSRRPSCSGCWPSP